MLHTLRIHFNHSTHSAFLRFISTTYDLFKFVLFYSIDLTNMWNQQPNFKHLAWYHKFSKYDLLQGLNLNVINKLPIDRIKPQID